MLVMIIHSWGPHMEELTTQSGKFLVLTPAQHEGWIYVVFRFIYQEEFDREKFFLNVSFLSTKVDLKP